jgi:hypothetical protein
MARSPRRTTAAQPQKRGFGLNTLVFFLIAIVFLVIVTFPIWRTIIIANDPVNVAFPNLTDAERNTLRQLPADELQILLGIASKDVERATDMAYLIQQLVTAGETFNTANLRPQRQGQFVTLDAVHRAEGNVMIYDIGGNNRLIHLQNFRTPLAPLNRDPAANTPGGTMELRLLFSTETTFTVEGANLGDTLDLAALKANDGNQNYNLAVNPARFKSLVIYSAKYGVVISYAVLN